MESQNLVHKSQLDCFLEHSVVVLQMAFVHLYKWVYRKRFGYVVALSKVQGLQFCSTFCVMYLLDLLIIESAKCHRVKSSRDVQC